MDSHELEKLNKGKEFPKLLFENKETKEVFKLIGGITIDNEKKLAIENEERKIVCSFKTLKKKYTRIGFYETSESDGEETDN